MPAWLPPPAVLSAAGLLGLGAAAYPRLRYCWRGLAALLALGCAAGLIASGHTTGLQQLLNGLFLGSIYALIALGYTMVYGVLKLINFAHGEIFMVGAFVGFFTLEGLPNQPYLALVLALVLSMVICAALGVLIERVAYRPLRNAPRLAALITAIGVSLLLQNLGLLIIGAQPRTMPAVLETAPIAALRESTGLIINVTNLITIGAAVLLMVGLQLIVSRTRTGRAMRAVSEDREASMLMGINVDVVIAMTFIIGSALAGAGGLLYGIKYPAIKPDLGVLPGLKAFVAAVLGGIGSVPGAMIGGMLIGVVEVLVSAVSASVQQIVHWVLTLLMLLALWRLTLGRLDWLPHSRWGQVARLVGPLLVLGGCYVIAGVVAEPLAALISAEPTEPRITGSTFRDAVVFTILIVILIVKPTGIMGRYAPEKV